MREPDVNLNPENALHSCDERLVFAAELHLRGLLGEPLTGPEREELMRLEAELPRAELETLLADLKRIDAALHSALQETHLSASFTARVISQLPSNPQPVSAPESGAAPAAPAAEPRIFTAANSGSRLRFWVPVTLGAAALIGLSLAGAWWDLARHETEPATGLAQPPDDAALVVSAQVVKGEVRDREGRVVQRLEPGRPYQAGPETVVLKTGSQALLRIAPRSEFEALEAQGPGALRLNQGSLYAHEPGAQPLRVRCAEFETEVAGTSWVMQENVLAFSNASERMGQGMLLVFQGSARVQAPLLGQTLTVSAGELYVPGLPIEPVQVFLRATEQRIGELERAAPAEGSLSQRARYSRLVEGYRHDLQSLDTQLASVKDDSQRAEVRHRRERVHDLLHQHRKRLERLQAHPEAEALQPRAKRLRRVVEHVRQGQSEFADPSTWL